MRLSEFLREDLVVYGLQAPDRSGVLKAMCDFLREGEFVDSSDEVFRALSEREAAHTTALGDGVAVPHAVIPSLKDRLLLVASTAEPVGFSHEEGGGDDRVDVFFVLLSPPGREGEHIKLLARICRLARHPGFLGSIREAKDAHDLFQVILDEDSRHV